MKKINVYAISSIAYIDNDTSNKVGDLRHIEADSEKQAEDIYSSLLKKQNRTIGEAYWIFQLEVYTKNDL